MLEVRYKGLNIAEVLDLSVEQARELFTAHPKITHILDNLVAVTCPLSLVHSL